MKKYRVAFPVICIVVCVAAFAVQILPYTLRLPAVPNPWLYILFDIAAFGSLALVTIYLGFRLISFFGRILDIDSPSMGHAIGSMLVTFFLTLLVIVAVIVELFIGLMSFVFAPATPSQVSNEDGSYWVSPGFPDPDFPSFHRVIGPFLMSREGVTDTDLAQKWNGRFDSDSSESPIEEATPTHPSDSPVSFSHNNPTPAPDSTATPVLRAIDAQGDCVVSIEEAGQGHYQAVWGSPAQKTVPVPVSYLDLRATCVTDTVAVISWTDLNGAYLLVTADAGTTWNTPDLPDPDGVGAYGRYFQEATGTDNAISIRLDYPQWESASTGGWWFVSLDHGRTWTRR